MFDACIYFALISAVWALILAVGRNELAGTSAVRVCIWAILISFLIGVGMGAGLWSLDRYVFHFRIDADSHGEEMMIAWRIYVSMGAIAGSAVGLLWGGITILTSLRRRPPGKKP
jgi:hypothetical protein